METKKNRWLIALSAVAIHLSIGSVYAYSVYQRPLLEQLGWGYTEISFSFTIAIFFLGTTAAFFGKAVENMGPRKAGFIAAGLFSGGLIGAGLMIQLQSLWGFYLMYGVVSGSGLGIGYIAPVSTLVRWFPDRRGLATGMAVFGFGAGSLLASPVARYLIELVGISWNFYILGSFYLILMSLGSSYIAKPPEGWKPEGFEADAEEKTKKCTDLGQFTRDQAVRTGRFWLLWWMMFINISAGIMIISIASPMAQEKVAMTGAAAATMVGIMGLFNGGGRIFWAFLSDYISRSNTFFLFFVVQTALFFILPVISSPLLFQVFIFIIMSMYGGGFANLPAFVGDLFGTKQLSAIHGYLLTSWAAAGIVGPMAVSFIREATQSYDATFYLFGGFLLTSLVASVVMKISINRQVGAKQHLAPKTT